jgi:ATP-dependent helicase HrpA
VDEGDSVAVAALASPAEQARSMWAGTRRLLLLNVASPVPALLRRLGRAAGAALGSSPYPSVEALLEDCVECALDELVVGHGGPPWDEAGFAALLATVRAELEGAARATMLAVAEVLSANRRVESRLAALAAPAFGPTVDDVRAQLGRLVTPGFVATVGTARLADIRRYLAAVEHRLDRLPGNVARDQDRLRAVQRLEEDYARRLAAVPVEERSFELLEVRWMLEELRVSTFAQRLGTAGPVSEPRIRRALEACAR